MDSLHIAVREKNNPPRGAGQNRIMKKTFDIDDNLLRKAKAASGAATYTETIRLGLEALIRQGAYERLRDLMGTERDLYDVSRRRTKRSLRHKVR
jgi:Bacterial antitoxin of type II TA system, VapB